MLHVAPCSAHGISQVHPTVPPMNTHSSGAGQGPAHIGDVPGSATSRHGRVVVVVVCVIVVVVVVWVVIVVVVVPAMIFRTGVQSIFAGPMSTFSVPNWFTRVACMPFGALASVVHATELGSQNLTPIL